DVWGETCTQYFFVDYTFLERPNFEGAKYVYTPPPRDKANQEILWNAVRTDILSAISTDHCAFLWDGQRTLGKADFSKIPTGSPEVVLLRGNVLVEGDELVAQPGIGQFVARAKFGEELRAKAAVA